MKFGVKKDFLLKIKNNMADNKNNKKDNSGPLVSSDVPKKIQYGTNYIKPKRPKSKKSFLLLTDKQARLIRSRKKKEIVSTEHFKKYIGKELLICGKKVYGSITLNEPIKLDRYLLNNHYKRHLINEKAILKRWPNDETFYAYSFKINKMFKKTIDKDFSGELGTIYEIENKIEKSDDNIIEGPVLINSNTYLDKYYRELKELKSMQFSGSFKEVAKLFLELYELYLNKSNSKIYDKNGIVLKPAPDITENYIRIRIRDPRTIVEGSFRTITISEQRGIKAVIGKLKSNPDGGTKIQSVLFEKNKWTTQEAVAWVNEHKEDLKNLDSNDLKEKKQSPKKVEVQEQLNKVEIWICPYCNKEIGEKELYCNDNDEWFHRPCLEKGPIVLPEDNRKFDWANSTGKSSSIEEQSETYINVGHVDKDKDKGKQKERWLWCDTCHQSFDYYKQLLNDESTIVCPNCGALIVFEGDE